MEEMAKINRSNYEEYVISYFDGSLDPVDVAGLLLFLEQNPDLKEEVQGLETITLTSDTEIQYNYKDLLTQPADIDAEKLTTSNFNYYFIAAHEGDLSVKGMKTVEAFIHNNPELRNDYKLYGAAKLKANPAIRFPNADKLRKPAITGIRQLIYLSAAAASILILTTIYLRIEPLNRDSIVEKTAEKEVPDKNTVDKKTEQPSVNQGNTELNDNQKKSRTIIINNKPSSGKPAGEAPVPSEKNTNEIKRLPSRHFLNTTPEPFNRSTRSFYSDLFDEITKSQEPMLAGMDTEQLTTPQNSLSNSRTGRRMGNLLRNSAHIASSVNQSISGWLLADIGIEGINILTDNELKLERIVNSDGRTEKVQLTESGTGYSFARKPN